MKNYTKVVLAIIISSIIALAGFSSVFAAPMTLQEGAEAARCTECPKDLFGETGAFRQITNTILYVVGIIAVIMLIIGGIKYVLSGGDSKKVTDAKNTVLYAIIGLVIAVFSYAIVNFVITSLPHTEEKVDTQSALTLTNTA